MTITYLLQCCSSLAKETNKEQERSMSSLGRDSIRAPLSPRSSSVGQDKNWKETYRLEQERREKEKQTKQLLAQDKRDGPATFPKYPPLKLKRKARQQDRNIPTIYISNSPTPALSETSKGAEKRKLTLYTISEE